MNPERWNEVKEAFNAALEVDPVERSSFIEERYANDPELLEEVRSLLEAADEPETLLEKPAVDSLPEALTGDLIGLAPGHPVGPYRIERELGRGGMGTVYLGRRDDEAFHKHVAIKVIKRGMDTDEVVRRFRHERQILAALEHPNIARLMDGGTTDGVPYFVMEYVEGRPIHRYCDDRKLDTKERLVLFRDVCSAVEHAHRNLIVHRDIKPANILVTVDGTPKLLDFGIAKLLNPDLSAHTLVKTATGQYQLTPEYASPEQARGEKVTTASDVYSLTVLLYELLTGHHPSRFDTRAPADIARVICEQEPQKASSVVLKSVPRDEVDPREPGTPHSVARTREGTPEKLRRRLRGDLDNILMMGLRKEPQRRYSSVEQLSEDIRRHLEGLPVIARADTMAYRTRKFVGRHRMGVVAGFLLVLTLFAGIVATARQARIAERRFQEVRSLANSFLFEFHDAIVDLAGSTPARELIVKKALEYLDRLSREAAGDPELQKELANAYVKVGDVMGNPGIPNLGDRAGALESYRKAAAIFEELRLHDPEDSISMRGQAVTWMRMGQMVELGGDTGEALELTEKAHDVFLRLEQSSPGESPDPEDLISSHSGMASLMIETGDVESAMQHLVAATTMSEAHLAEQPNDLDRQRSVALRYDRLADALRRTGDTVGALERYRNALALREKISQAEPGNARGRRDVAAGQAMVGDLLSETGDLEGALESMERSLSIFEELEAADPRNVLAKVDVALTHQRMGDLHSWRNDPRKALLSYQAALRIRESLAAVDPQNADSRHAVMVSYNDLGDTLGHPQFPNLGDTAGALRSYRNGLDIALELSQGDPSNARRQDDLWLSYNKVGEMLELQGDLTSAREYFEKALPIAKALSDRDSRNVIYLDRLALSYELLGNLLNGQGDSASAISHHRRVVEIREGRLSGDSGNTRVQVELANACSNLGASLTSSNLSEAIRSFGRSLELWEDLRQRGVVPPQFAEQPDKVAQELERLRR